MLLFNSQVSGNCYKVRLLLTHLGLGYDRHEVDYAYTHVADEAGFDLARYPAMGSWLERVARQPRHVPITA